MSKQNEVSINRYCAIECSDVKKCEPFLGLDTFFLAYSSNPDTRDFADHLRKELNDKGYKATTWEDTVENDLIFNKICNLIHTHDYLLAEVTYPNLNVLFEVGYALAVGRMPILLINKNKSDLWKNRTILSTLESCRYKIRSDIHEYINTLTSNRKIPKSPTNRKLPFLDHMNIYAIPPSTAPPVLYHLKPRVATDWLKKVDSLVKASGFTHKRTDPSDTTYDDFYHSALGIQKSYAVIASLLSEEYDNYLVYNANVALLAGFAVGLGKRVLILQHKPSKPMLDVGSILREFGSESEVHSIVKQWLSDNYYDNNNNKSISNKHMKRKTKQIRETYMGHPDAMQDFNLSECFVETDIYIGAKTGTYNILVGRRGIGKSAHYRVMCEELRKDKSNIVVSIYPDDYELEQLADYLKYASDSNLLHKSTSPKLIYPAMWSYVLSTELLKSLKCDFNDYDYYANNHKTREFFDKLNYYYNDNYDNFQRDFGSRVINILNKIRNDKEFDDKYFMDLRHYDINKILKHIAHTYNLTFRVIIDDLDKNWDYNSSESIHILLGLLTELDRMSRFFEGKFNYTLFLREDIFSVLSEYDDNLVKRRWLTMTWNKDELKYLVTRRLVTNAPYLKQDSSVNDIWTSMFCESVGDLHSLDYVLDHVINRPRDVLSFCQECIYQANSRGHHTIIESDIITSEQKLSDIFLSSIASEFLRVYPRLDEVILEFAGAYESMVWDTYVDYLNIILDKYEDVVNGWAGVGSDLTYYKITEILFYINMIGLSGNSGKIYYRNGRSFKEVMHLVGDSPKVYIHSAFKLPLEIRKIN